MQPLHAGRAAIWSAISIAPIATRPALHARDCEGEGFRWIVADDRDQSVFAFLRFGGPDDPPVAVDLQFHAGGPLRLSDRPAEAGRWREILNTDAADLWRLGRRQSRRRPRRPPLPAHGCPASADIILPPLATIYLRI